MAERLTDEALAEVMETYADVCDAFRGDKDEPCLDCGFVFDTHRSRDGLWEVKALRERDDESAGDLRSIAEDVGALSQRLWSRMGSGDIPWDAGCDIQGEFCSEIRDLQARVQAVAKKLVPGEEKPRA